MFYGAAVWDPWLIVAQIVCLQCLYYLTMGIFMAVLVGTRVSRLSLVYFFDYGSITATTATGWCVIASFILSSIVGAGILVYLIERAKKCLDFSATLYIIHLFICIAYGGWPSSLTWWVVNATGFAIMALLGEFLCIQRELQEIPIPRYRPIDWWDAFGGSSIELQSFAKCIVWLCSSSLGCERNWTTFDIVFNFPNIRRPWAN